MSTDRHVIGRHLHSILPNRRVIDDDAFHIINAVTRGDLVPVVHRSARPVDHEVQVVDQLRRGGQ